MKKVLKSISTCFVILAMLTTAAFAAAPSDPIQPQASEFIFKTTTAVVALDNGYIEFDFTITATRRMKDVGALQVDIYKVGTSKPVWSHYYTDDGYGYFMGHDRTSYTFDVTYHGNIGSKYYANVQFFAGEDGVAGDIYPMGSAVVTARK